MSNFEFTIFFLVVYLILLIIFKIIFKLAGSGESEEKKEDNKKIKTIEVEGFGIADDVEEKPKKEESLTTYIANDKKTVSKINYNSEDQIGNYMHDIMVLNQPIPDKNRFVSPYYERDDNNSVVDEKIVKNNIKKVDEKEEVLEEKIQAIVDKKFEQLVKETTIDKENVMQEYKGLSKEMKMFLIAKILDRRITM